MLHFREELEELQSKLLEMGGMVEAAIHNSVYALVERDEERAKEVMWNEAQVNQREMEIDELATRMLALFQPMARDLRFITAVIKMNSDLERMGDLAVNITERALSLMREPRCGRWWIFRASPNWPRAWCTARWTHSRAATPIWRARYCWPTTKWITCAIPFITS